VTRFTSGLCYGTLGITCGVDRTPISCIDGRADPVCGMTQEGCNDIYCMKTYGNSCGACGDPAVISYIPGVCPGDDGVYCDVINRPIDCSNEISSGTVCGSFESGCEEDYCRRTYENPCLACKDPLVSYYTTGVCPKEGEGVEENEETIEEEEFTTTDDEEGYTEETTEDIPITVEESEEENTHPNLLVNCRQAPSQSCSDAFNPVCVFSTTGCVSGVCQQTVRNRCDACSDVNAIAFLPGRCDSEKNFCEISRPTQCEGLNQGSVCAFRSGCDGFGESCWATYVNSCEACKDPNIIFYTNGQCSLILTGNY